MKTVQDRRGCKNENQGVIGVAFGIFCFQLEISDTVSDGLAIVITKWLDLGSGLTGEFSHLHSKTATTGTNKQARLKNAKWRESGRNDATGRYSSQYVILE